MTADGGRQNQLEQYRPETSGPAAVRRLRAYIDIDGTILYEPDDGTTCHDDLDFQLVCEGLAEFLEFVVRHCEPYWLSYRTRLGTLRHLEDRLYRHLPEIARVIPAAHWKGFKHEGVAPEAPFVWFDDDLEPEDVAWLMSNNHLGAHVQMDATNRGNPRLMIREVQSRMQSAI